MAATRSRDVRTNFKIHTSGMDSLLAELEALTDIEPIAQQALYKGADIMADEMHKQIANLKTTKDNYRPDRRYCYPKEKKLLLDEMGYTPVSFWGEKYNVKIGFDGYGYATPKYPGGIPTQLLANTINRGTSFMIPQPFITRTQGYARKKAIQAIIDYFEETIEKLSRKNAA